MKTKIVLAAAAIGLSVPVLAASGNNYVDGYYVPSAEVDTDGGDVDGDGLGVKGSFEVAPQVFLTGEYQSNDYDDGGGDLDGLRLGAAFGKGAGSTGAGLYGRVEYIDYDFDNDSQSGFGGHVGYGLPLSDQFRLYGEAGYLKLDDVDGPEFLVGGAYKVAPNIGVFVDYRINDFDVDNSSSDLQLNELRVGARFYF